MFSIQEEINTVPGPKFKGPKWSMGSKLKDQKK